MTNPPFLDLVPMLMCTDVQASIRFYTDVLGFEVTGRMDDVGATGFAHLRNGRTAVMLASPSYIPPGQKVDGRFPQSHYYFYVADAEGLRQSIVDKGWEATECVDRFYDIKEFELVDPDGHVLVFGQDITP
ncbi:MAG: VOC family protein [Gammaproteobacteria bacterium]|nr:VOC family protein [Gammaproteobacteria bacterium]